MSYANLQCRFPRDQFVRRQWVNAIQRKNFMPSNTSVLCSRHFTAECFTYGKSGSQKRVFIKPNAVPTLFPPITQSRRSLMRSILPPPSKTECSENGFLASQSSNPEEYVKLEAQAYTDTNVSEAGMSIESAENVLDMEFLKEQGSSIDWVEHFDQSNSSPAHVNEQSASIDWVQHCERSNDSITQYNRESNPPSFAEEQKNCDDSDDVFEFKSRRRILKNLNSALSRIAAQRKELKIVKQKNRLLEKRLSILKALLTHVLSEKILSEDENISDSESESEIWSG
ncbi:THAP domain-containing protein 2-like isoform X2 [Neodiprion virginianus]|uniref:THAP domain-containing protein 2 isoform X2 n=1 Tax=Neodiprion lecontei TaxID=441921 RepID=A0ABM3GED3_NEOLC|nr:THAP domain-containing protein 2-like isoform X2 [Neodiprion fabricii]XP_046430130.1 THAP domain-containing protein 2-like isoform X2 [Neodiprion fabricii]XP_046598600.1 THAP domain-containing protein 2 isoform X2 [Neodiprion lecontei]XP_046598601.1 THAP domain-containing protein 2 isoform X2 [Neodiprion lecontei]XP_046625679.1 THAP domain-containing protein 2-like isoform X2 [Neodiprion virginianus]XP_046625680.1 THAP domain-containing protein 2-like isoform X2 [Neodiprion virginianus]